MHHHSAFALSVAITLTGLYQLNAVRMYIGTVLSKVCEAWDTSFLGWQVSRAKQVLLAGIALQWLFYRSTVFGTSVLFLMFSNLFIGLF